MNKETSSDIIWSQALRVKSEIQLANGEINNLSKGKEEIGTLVSMSL
jgi:hypothetical protein